MKRKFLLPALLFALSPALLSAEPAPTPDPQVVAAIKELQAQQAQIADNQAKIDSKMASIAEAVRIARIYASRVGK